MTVVQGAGMRERQEEQKAAASSTLDDGSGTPRQILSGIAKYYQAGGAGRQDGRRRAPTWRRSKMMGQESNGMLLSAEKDEKLNLLMLDDSIPAGAKLC